MLKPEPRIETIDQAKAALDERIASEESSLAYRQAAYDAAKASLASVHSTLWALRSIRRRMDPLPAEVTDKAGAA